MSEPKQISTFEKLQMLGMRPAEEEMRPADAERMPRDRGKFLPSETTDISPEKAREILKDDNIEGEPLSGPQKGFFRTIAGMDNGKTNRGQKRSK